MALKEQYANIVLIGNKEKIQEKAEKNKLDISGAKIIDPCNSEKYDEYVNLLYELRKNKGMTIENAKELVKNPVYYGMLMVKDEETGADGLVSGAAPFYIRYIKTGFTNIKNSTWYKISFCLFCYGSTRLRIWSEWSICICR